MRASLPDLVAIDTETTGLDPASDKIIELAAARLIADPRTSRIMVADTFSALVRPGIPLPLFTQRKTGITSEELAQAAAFAEVYPAFLDFVGDAVVVGHNVVEFDLPRLANEARAAHLPPLTNPTFDTLTAALLLFPELDRHALDILAAYLNVETPTHRALTDAVVTGQILAALARRASALTDVERRLLTTAGFAPLKILDALGFAADQPPTAPRASERRDERLPDIPPPLSCAASDWRTDLTDSNGIARRLPGFRQRTGQIELAEHVEAILAQGGIGLFEAGTGMGKSLAYLLPAAFASAARGARVIVATKTKALQRQLATHELPLVEGGLPSDWRWTLLMGRENYICRRRLDEAVAETSARLDERERSLALAYLLGRARRGEVDLSALPYRALSVLPALGALAYDLRSTTAACRGKRCPVRQSCPWRLARTRAARAHVVVVNHALLLAGADHLPPFEDLIIDEAHLLRDEALSAFSEEVESTFVNRLLEELLPRRGQSPLATRLLAAARRAEPATGSALRAAASACQSAARDLPQRSRELAAALSALIDVGRATEERPGEDTYARTLWLTPGLQEQREWDEFAAAAETLAGITGIADPDYVTWAELPSADYWKLTRSPLSPAAHLRELLWDRLRSAVLTSATLTTTGSFAYIREALGLHSDLDVQERIFPSPFAYERQAVLIVEDDPGVNLTSADLPERQAAQLKRLADATGGRLLALFTNTRQMQSIAAQVAEHAEQNGVLVLAQGVHGSAAALADEFRSDPSTVLLGVDTLWTGQDFPGDVLVCLAIAKLPFARQDPLYQARRRAAEQEGRDWFNAFYLPEAILKFRQGFGRLIRTESDYGVIVVLDPRLPQRRYFSALLKSLPRLRVVKARPDDLADRVRHELSRLASEQDDS